MSRIELETAKTRLGITDIKIVTPNYVLDNKNILTDSDFFLLLIIFKENYYQHGYDKGCEDAY